MLGQLLAFGLLDWMCSSWSDSVGLLGLYHFHLGVLHLHFNGALAPLLALGAVGGSGTVFVKVFHHNVGVVRAGTDQAEEDGKDDQTLQN